MSFLERVANFFLGYFNISLIFEKLLPIKWHLSSTFTPKYLISDGFLGSCGHSNKDFCFRTHWVEPQYLDRLHRESLFFWQKSLRTINTYHLVPFKLPKNVQGGPFQGLLVFKHFFPKIPNFTKYALTPSFLGRPSSVIPFRKALAIPIAGPYWSLS